MTTKTIVSSRPGGARLMRHITAAMTCSACLLVTVLCSCAAYAQTVNTEAVRQKLSKVIHLNLGKTTLQTVAASLAEQTDLAFDVPDNLRDRAMIVNIDNKSAFAAISALAELHDWSWKETAEGGIRISRSALALPRTMGSIPSAVKSALPKDLRTFLGVPRPGVYPAGYRDPNLEFLPSGPRDRIEKKLFRYLRDTQRDLFSNLPEGAMKGDPIPFAKFAEAQRADITVQIVFRLLGYLSEDKLLAGDLARYVYDPGLAQLEADRNYLMITSHALVNGQDRHGGIGGPVTP